MSTYGCCHGDASHTDIEILRAIDSAHISAQNEAVVGSARGLFRAHCASASKAHFCDSDGSDPELLLHVPFTEQVQLRSICVSAAEGGCPSSLSLFVNAPGLTFDEAGGRASAQELPLAGHDEAGAVFYPLRAARFNNVMSLQLLFRGRRGTPAGEDAEGPVRLFFIGLKGEASGIKRQVVEGATYEVNPRAVENFGANPLTGGGFLGGK
jgi:hypothetical protein